MKALHLGQVRPSIMSATRLPSGILGLPFESMYSGLKAGFHMGGGYRP